MNREEFPMLNTNYIYLDNGATTWKPQSVIQKITDYYTKYTANAHRGDYDISLKVDNEYELIGMLKDLANMRQEYSKVLVAMQQVRNTGYGVVMPVQEEITLEAPELIKHGNKYGVKIKAKSPSIHMIRAGIETEIAPIVGTKEQAEDLINYIKAADNTEEGVWETKHLLFLAPYGTARGG